MQMTQVVERHDEILRTTVEARGGYVFKTVGDACCAAFAYPREALRAALASQRTLFAEAWSVPTGLRVRMALHTGAAEQERDGDYFGPAVNRVARLLSAVHGGQVLLSGATYSQVRDHPQLVDPEARLVYLGEYRLKDLTHPERLYQLSVPDLPGVFPPARGDKAPDDFDERYRFKDFLGSGGMAKVYVAHDEGLDRDVAIKVLHPRYVEDEQFVERFKREARSAGKLSHPNIVPIHDRGEKKDGTYYMVMEHLPGGTLKDLIMRGDPLAPRRIVELALQIAQALEVAHRRGIVHRDIKPQNILLTESGDVKVADFGIAKAASSSTLTHTGFLVGTPHYISPEQAEGEPASFSSDLYSLGVVLYEMLTGELPFDADTPIGILSKHAHGQLRSPREMNPNIPEVVTAVTERLLAKDPKDRYPSAAALVEDLQRVLRSLEEDGPGTVVERPASGGSGAEEGPAVAVDTGPSTVLVPDLTGKNAFRASSTLAMMGLTLGDQREIPSETIPAGEIIEQTPKAGTEVAPGSMVSIALSSGLPTVREAPDLTDQTVTGASSGQGEPTDAGTRADSEQSAEPGGEARTIGATDAARRQAAELGVDLREVEGTGTDGRITAADVEKTVAPTERTVAETQRRLSKAEVDRRYAELERQYDAGNLSAGEFDAQLKQMVVRDAAGRLWVKHRETGEWHYYYEANTRRQRPGYPVNNASRGANARGATLVLVIAVLVVMALAIVLLRLMF